MPLNIKHREADALARELSRRTGETITQAVINALRERLEREKRQPQRAPLSSELAAIRQRCSRLPVLDNRSADEILGYNDHGLPG